MRPSPIKSPRPSCTSWSTTRKTASRTVLLAICIEEDLLQELLYEDDAIKAEREKCEKLLKTYKEAAKIVGEVL